MGAVLSVQNACFGIAAFEAVAWTVDSPLFTHDGPLGPRVAIGLLNSLPHLAMGLHLSQNGGSPSSLAISLYAPYALTFATQQVRFWWAPYFLGMSAPLDRALLDHKPGLERAIKVLPKLPWSARLPALEHTLLIAPSVWLASWAVQALPANFDRRDTLSVTAMAAMSLVGTLPPVAAVAKAWTDEKSQVDWVNLAVLGGYWGMLGGALFWPSLTKA
jgi:hypothetical protein